MEPSASASGYLSDLWAITMVKAAIIGAGVFGCTTAVDLARAGVDVSLFEEFPDILEGATARCQARLHSGYHYPRSPGTALAARDGAREFVSRYPTAIIDDVDQYYIIASSGKTSPDEFRTFCRMLDLPYTESRPMQAYTDDLCVRVPESFVDVRALRRILRMELRGAGVKLHLSHRINNATELSSNFDVVIWATYGAHWDKPLRYEICEVAVLEVSRYGRQSFVVLDGDFVSMDPYYDNTFLLYGVNETVHWAMVSNGFPEVPAPYNRLVKKAPVPIRNSPVSNFSSMIDTASKFLWGLESTRQGVSIYHGSLWAVRAILPNVEDTDARPTLVSQSGNHIKVLSGKISTAVTAARQITEMVINS